MGVQKKLNSMFLKVQQMSRKTRTVILLIMIFSTLFICNNNLKSDQYKSERFSKNVPAKPVEYLINTTFCKIPKLNPFNEDVLPYVWKEELIECSDKPLLTYIEQTSVGSKLKINQSVIHLYNSFGLTCCYSYILRDNGDFKLSYSACVYFDNEVEIELPHIKVVCRNHFFWKVYENVHTAIKPKAYVSKTANYLDQNPIKWRIIMLGMDSMSNLNIQRTMPKVHALLEDQFISFRGYNKIEDNTFPNLMAIFTGRSYSTLEPNCLMNETFDRCNLIWKEFANRGYITAYGEDEPSINTFTLSKEGFFEPPTDVYLRPYFLAAYKLSKKIKSTMTVCSGPETTTSRMFNAAKSFLQNFNEEPIFAFYWLNSFSHDSVNEPSAMEELVLNFLTSSTVTQAMDNSIFVVFSDHGFRFGDIRFTYSGWLEERLPFIYVRFPKLFQDTYPDLVKNFKLNAQHRLTTPYDFYMTLQHILWLTDPTYSIQPSRGCPNCHSLFELVSFNRSCEDAGIEQHWCTCGGYTTISVTDPQVVKVASFVIGELNQLIQDEDEGYKCAEYSLRSIESVGMTESAVGRTFLMLVQTYPNAMFEATARWSNGQFTLLGSMSRLNKYKDYSQCVTNSVLKKYCFCDSWWAKMASHVCYVLKCAL